MGFKMPAKPTGRPVWEGPRLMLHHEPLSQSLCVLVNGVEQCRFTPIDLMRFVSEVEPKKELYEKLVEAGARPLDVIQLITATVNTQSGFPLYPPKTPVFPLYTDPRLAREGGQLLSKHLRAKRAVVHDPPRMRFGPRLRAFRRFTWVLTKELFYDLGSM